MFAWIFRTSWPEMVAFRRKTEGKMWYDIDPNEIVLTSVPILVKIDQEMQL